MKEFILGLTFLALLVAFPFSWWVNYQYQDSVAMAIRSLEDQNVIDQEEIGRALGIQGSRVDNHSIAKKFLPEENLIWRWISLPAGILLVFNAFFVFRSASRDRKQNNSAEGTA